MVVKFPNVLGRWQTDRYVDKQLIYVQVPKRDDFQKKKNVRATESTGCFQCLTSEQLSGENEQRRERSSVPPK